MYDACREKEYFKYQNQMSLDNVIGQVVDEVDVGCTMCNFVLYKAHEALLFL